MSHIAFYTFGILHGNEDHPGMNGFFDSLDIVFEEAKQSEGFIGLDTGDWGTRFMPRFFDKEKHSCVAATLSLWKDLESVYAFAYRKGHGEGLKHRYEWFLKGDWPVYVAWWVEDGHIPTREEACKKLEHLHDNGSGPSAFDFKKPFNEKAAEIELNRALIRERVKTNSA